MDKKVTAICCGAIDYKDSDKLVTLCSVEEGKITAVVKGVKKPKAKLRFSATPFCFAEYVLAQKGEYHTVISCSPIDQFTSIIGDVDKFYAGSVILDALRNAVGVNEETASVMVVALKYLKSLAYEDQDVSLLLISFFLSLFDACGYGLDFSACRVCRTKNFTRRYFSFTQGGIVCRICAKNTDQPVSGEASGLIKAILDGISLSVLRYDESVKRETLNLLNAYFGQIFTKKLTSLEQYLDISKSV